MIRRLISISIVFYCCVNLLSAQAYSPDPCHCYRGGGLSFSEGEFLVRCGITYIPLRANFLSQNNLHRPTDLALHSLNGPVKSVITLQCRAADSLGVVVRGERYCDSVSNFYDERGYCVLFWGASAGAPTDGDRATYLAEWDEYGRPLFITEPNYFDKDTFDRQDVYLYDDQGRLKEVQSKYNTSALSDSRRFRKIGPDSKTFFVYEDSIVKVYYVDGWDESLGSMPPGFVFEPIDTVLTSILYFKNNRLVSINGYSADGYLSSKQIYNYDADNHRSESYLYLENGKWKEWERQHIYNKEGILVAEGHDTLGCADQFINDINDNVRYEFDEYNNWVKRIVYNEYGIPLRLHEREIEYYE